MIKTIILKSALLCALTVVALPVQATEKEPLDRVALQRVKVGKGLFDINLGDATKLPLYLGVIKETYTGLKRQGVKPDFVIAFRGTAVKLISSERANFSLEQKEALLESDALIKELAAMGVKFEACAVATRLFGVENKNILPQVTVVGNTFISLIGYQSKGYALIPVQ